MTTISKIRNVLAMIMLFAGLFGGQKALACHLAAADINVTYIGPNSDGCTGTSVYEYRVEVSIYYACLTCNGDGGKEMDVYYSSPSAVADGLPNASGKFKVGDTNTNSENVHQLCGEFKDSNSCKNLDNAKLYPGFRVRRRSGTVILPYPRKDWTFWCSEGARSQSNLDLGAGCGSLYVEASLDNLTKYNNSTVKFLSNPLPYICVNQPKTYLNTPYDPNGDSINVELQTPYDGFGTGPLPPGVACSYLPGSSAANPAGAPGGFFLNKLTGAAEFTPVTTGQFVFAFRGEDYAYGTNTRLSYVYRDVQVSILPCQAPPPNIDTLSRTITNITNGTVIKTKNFGDAVFVCPGSNMSLDLSSTSVVQGGKVFMYANTGIFNGSTFTTVNQGSDSVTGTFAWTPTSSDIGLKTLVIESKDSTCLVSQPIVLISYRVILVNIVNGIDAGPDVKICAFNPQPVPLYVYGAEDLRVKWTLDGGPAHGINNDAIRNPLLTTGVESQYVVTTPDLAGACKASDTIETVIDPGDGVLIKPHNPIDRHLPMVMCRPGYLQLEAFPLGRGRKGNIACGPVTPKPCENEDTATIYGSILYKQNKFDTTTKAAFDLDNKVRTSKMEYLIHRHEMQKSDIWASTLNAIGFTIKGGDNPNYTFSNFKIFIKCTDKEELNNLDGFSDPATLTEVYSAAQYFFTDGYHHFPFISNYNWDTSKNIIVQMHYSNNQHVDTCGGSSRPAIFTYVPTSYASALFIKPGPSAANPQVPDSNVADLSATLLHNDIKALATRPLTTFSYCEVPGLDFVMKWYYGNQLSDSTTASTLAYVPKSTHFVAETIGRSGCKTRDTLYVYVPEHDYKISPEDTSICLGDKAPLMVYGGHFFKWYEYENGQYLPPASVHNPVSNYTFIGPDKTTEYRIVVSDSVFCYDTLSARVRVMPLPDVRILNQDDTTVRYGQQFQLLASGARLYNWSPVSSLNNPNISYPIARPTEDTKYIVGGIGANGCRAFDTLHVIVDKRDNLFVPSAFSPNGDGRNDVFRITNLSFQRIMEFRVFNRWGQEVYSTNDSRAGWDGTWGGVPQDMGVYTYLIRVAYPDGYVETYRGETSLIR